MFGGRKHSVGKTGEKLPEKHEGLPDSTHPYGLCPRCQKQSSFDVVATQAVTFDPEIFSVERDGQATRVPIDQVAILYCRNCRQCTVVVEEQLVAGISWREPRTGGGTVTWRGMHWWPAVGTDVSGDVPVDIPGVFEEAIRALHAECPRAAAVMARRKLEAITANNGETSGVI